MKTIVIPVSKIKMFKSAIDGRIAVILKAETAGVKMEMENISTPRYFTAEQIQKGFSAICDNDVAVKEYYNAKYNRGVFGRLTDNGSCFEIAETIHETLSHYFELTMDETYQALIRMMQEFQQRGK